MKFKQHIDELYEIYVEELCNEFNESLESIDAISDGKNKWVWEFDGLKYRAKVAKINGIYHFTFGADMDGTIVTGDTHTGHPLKAFAGALSALKQFISKVKPKEWQYCGFIKREKLYDKFSDRIGKELHYRLTDKYIENTFIIYYTFERL